MKSTKKKKLFSSSPNFQILIYFWDFGSSRFPNCENLCCFNYQNQIYYKCQSVDSKQFNLRNWCHKSPLAVIQFQQLPLVVISISLKTHSHLQVQQPITGVSISRFLFCGCVAAIYFTDLRYFINNYWEIGQSLSTLRLNLGYHHCL